MQCSVESTLDLENAHFQFLVKILSSLKFLGHPSPWTQTQQEMEVDGLGFTMDRNKAFPLIHPIILWNLIKVKDSGPQACGFFAFETLQKGKGASIYVYCFVKKPKAGKSRKKLP